MKSGEYIVGIDEAGRGPLAGPVAVGIVAVPSHFNTEEKLEGVFDSKQLTEKRRNELYKILCSLRSTQELNWTVSYSSHTVIDEVGIVPAVHRAIKKGLKALDEVAPQNCSVLLDGSLRAPSRFKDQSTIIRGDEKEPLISAASILAKVDRDNRMKSYAQTYTQYGFDAHKGYPTKQHYEAIKNFGICPIHRRSYLSKNLTQ